MSEYFNLSPGSTVPKSGKYRCQMCSMTKIVRSGKPSFSVEELSGILGMQGSVRFFQAGQTFTQCPNCGPATGWTLVEEG